MSYLITAFLQSFNRSIAMLGFLFLNLCMRLAIIFFYTFVWIPLLRLKEAILSVVSVFRLAFVPELDGSGGETLLVRRIEELQRSDVRAEEEICSICLMEFAREDSVCELPDCSHVFHFSCIEKWHERNRFTCPLCRCVFFNIGNRQEKKLQFVVPDNPSCLYYFLQ